MFRDRYRQAMNRQSLSDEQKQKLIAAASGETVPISRLRRRKRRRIVAAASMAACLALIAAAAIPVLTVLAPANSAEPTAVRSGHTDALAEGGGASYGHDSNETAPDLSFAPGDYDGLNKALYAGSKTAQSLTGDPERAGEASAAMTSAVTPAATATAPERTEEFTGLPGAPLSTEATAAQAETSAAPDSPSGTAGAHGGGLIPLGVFALPSGEPLQVSTDEAGAQVFLTAGEETAVLPGIPAGARVAAACLVDRLLCTVYEHAAETWLLVSDLTDPAAPVSGSALGLSGAFWGLDAADRTVTLTARTVLPDAAPADLRGVIPSCQIGGRTLLAAAEDCVVRYEAPDGARSVCLAGARVTLDSAGISPDAVRLTAVFLVAP